MSREDVVKIRAKSGAAAFAAGERYALLLSEGESTSQWVNGAPITRAEWTQILEPTGLFELVPAVREGRH
jgi:hypothetical protein